MSRYDRFVDVSPTPPSHNYNKPHPCAQIQVPRFSEIERLLKYELQAKDNDYKEAWENAKDELLQRKQELPNHYFKDNIPEEVYIAIMAYTIQNPPLYKNFNDEFREMTSKHWKFFPYKSLYFLLCEARRAVVYVPTNDPSMKLYRYTNHFLKPTPQEKQPFYFDSCASCSVSDSVARNFFHGKGTKIIIEEGPKTAAVGIASYSAFPEEKEVLVFPTNKFEIVKYEKKELNFHEMTLRSV